MSKRVNNHKGWPSKNKANNRYLRNMRNERDGITKAMAKAKEGDDTKNLRMRLGSVQSLIKLLTPKRFHRHQSR